ncbi:tail length tape-measure protein [Staphylococcus phage CF5]|uniref:Tail length tape-measure protein n=1 Tax=Staphylococcus phage CF5 TaxID=3113739 RepID=A0AAX4J7B3_9CAUD|nr:tail length tape-measure protein [Staphylococcus phage CF5]
MAMNDDYRLVLSSDSSDLENGLKTIEAYMDAIESKKIDAPLDGFANKLKTVAKEIRNVQQMMDKQEGKSVVSSKDMDKTIQSTKQVTQHINDLKQALDDIQKANIAEGIAPDPNVEKTYQQLNKTLNDTQGNLEELSKQSIGSDSSINNRIKEMKTLGQVTEETNKLMKDSSSVKDYSKQLRASRTMVKGHIDRSSVSGRMSYEQGTRVRNELGKTSRYEKEREQNKQNITNARKEYQGYASRQQDLTNRKSKGNISNESYEKELASIKAEMKAREDLINQYEKLGSELDKTIGYYKGSAQNDLNDRRVESRPGSLSSMAKDGAKTAGISVAGVATGMYMKGASLSETNRPMVTSLGQNSDNMDIDSVRNTYGEMSIDNKLGYNSTDMLKMATSYEGAVGHKSDADTLKGAEQLAVGGRSLGIQNQEQYQESMSQIMHTGGVNSSNMKEMQDAFIGGIKESGMVGRQDEQLKALGSIAEQSGQGRTMSQGEMSNLTAMQSTLAGTGNKGLQGEQGANAMNSIDQGIKNGMSNSYARISMGWGTEYQGLEGMHDLQARMDKGISDPENLTDILGQAEQMGGTTKEQQAIAKKSFDSMGANLTQEQTDDLFNLYKSGKLSKEELAKKAKQMESEGDKEGKGNRKKYEESNAGKNDQNKAKTDDKAEDTYDMAQPLRDAHSALAGLPAPIYLAIAALGAFTASLAGSAAMMGGRSLLNKGSSMVRNRRAGKQGGQTPGGGQTPNGGGMTSGGTGKPKDPKNPNTGGGSNGKTNGGKLDRLKGLGRSFIGGEGWRGGTRSTGDQVKGAGSTVKNLGQKGKNIVTGTDWKGLLTNTENKLGRSGRSVGRTIKDTTKETNLGKIPSMGKGLMNKGKGLVGRFGKGTKGGKLGISSHAPGGGMMKGLGKLGRVKGLGAISTGLSALSIGSSLASGDKEGVGKGVGGLAGATAGGTIGATLGSVVPGLGTAVGGFIGSSIGGMAGDAIGGSIGKKGIKKSLGVGFKKPKGADDFGLVGKAWKGITGLFDGDDDKEEKGGKGGGSKGNIISYKLIALLVG